jgi:hypothetical protein
MHGKTGSMYLVDGYVRAGKIVEYVLTDAKWSMDYELEGILYHEQAVSTDGVSYHGAWGEPGQKDPGKVLTLCRWTAKNGDVMMDGEWLDKALQDGGYYRFVLPAGTQEK